MKELSSCTIRSFAHDLKLYLLSCNMSATSDCCNGAAVFSLRFFASKLVHQSFKYDAVDFGWESPVREFFKV
jgi:hypothetical protein